VLDPDPVTSLDNTHAVPGDAALLKQFHALRTAATQ
jgi:hypothetical protein